MTSAEALQKLSKLSDRDLLARLIFGESRGECSKGQLAVAHVAMNRLKSGHYGAIGGLKGVILKSYQFSCFNPLDPNLPLMLDPPKRDPFACCVLLAELVLDDLTVDPTNGASHYFNPDVVPGRWPASWDRSKMQFKARVGRHEFYLELLTHNDPHGN